MNPFQNVVQTQELTYRENSENYILQVPISGNLSTNKNAFNSSTEFQANFNTIPFPILHLNLHLGTFNSLKLHAYLVEL